ncbi:ABC transporter permease subunit [Actinomyces ruminicola]|uniref:Maltose/maltodextrin transport system permease protein n=1 Tax=Actinomyces ruminicola TaxID=332524 RepID=A0A1G9VVL7_9ACTO|nr:ABC transporter permease subunit [Actinomyces ruminicola]SDM76011.1 arabinogalactan oligomer / maltooligosaccharide transport system permease protein [Actinomyces ruminicola]
MTSPTAHKGGAHAAAGAETPDSSRRTARERTTTIRSVLGRVLVLGAALAVAAYLVPLLIAARMWLWLFIVVAATVAIFVLYSTRRFIPGKYFFPGTFFLAVFLIVPIVMTVQTAFTNFGDGFRGTKEDAVTTITNNSVVQAPDSPLYNLSVATTGSVEDGPFTLFLVDTDTEDVLYGADGETVQPATDVNVTVTDGFVTAADGYTILTGKQINTAYDTISTLTLSVSETSAIKVQGVRSAFEGTKTMVYDEQSDSITNTKTGDVYTVQKVGNSEYYVNANGDRLAQSWKQNIGLANFAKLFGNRSLIKQLGGAFTWTLIFAGGSMLLTFILGYFLALTLNDDRIRGKKLYRSFLLLPYAVPGFISLLIWSNFYNRDFGLINEMLNLHINWLGDPNWAKVAVLLTNMWMGFPYMFIVCTGALQSIPDDLKEAARIDGANGWQTTTRVITPLLLVSVAPLLVSTFAFNFNNFNAIQLLTEGGPFAAGEYTRGGTDILISMVYRIAFGGSGADYGFASAVSVVLFVITGVLAAAQFTATRRLEDIN